jgi:hypothetical protein
MELLTTDRNLGNHQPKEVLPPDSHNCDTLTHLKKEHE